MTLCPSLLTVIPTSWFAQNAEETVDFALGTYVTDSEAGIRRFPYSTSAQTNPLRYSNLRQFRQVHGTFLSLPYNRNCV